MRWRTIGPHSIESENGYVILQCNSYGKPIGLYLSMLGRTRKDAHGNTIYPVQLERHASREEAQAFCERHFAAFRVSAA